MDPLKTFCPNLDCPARGRIGEANIKVHDRKRRRYRCGVCGRTFSEREGTTFYRLHTASEVVALVLTLIAYGCPIAAIVAAFGFQGRTVRAWIEKAGLHCEEVHEHLVERPREHEQVQADEIRVKLQKEKGKPVVVWAAMAVAVGSRLWLGACDSVRRDRALARAILDRVRRATAEGPILFATDGWSAYKEAARRTFRSKAPSKGGRGRPRLVAWADRVFGMVVKRTKKKRVVEVSRRLLEGTEADLAERLKASQGGGTLNTSYIERLNASFRARLFCLVRRTRGLARRPALLHAGLFLIGTVYNFCGYHDSLSEDGSRTPAMAAGIADHRWSVEELLSYRIPLPRWTPPKRRGRRSKRLLELIERWAT